MLARLAASAHKGQSADDEAAIEKYLRSVLSLENILTLDRLRQVGAGSGPKSRWCLQMGKKNFFFDRGGEYATVSQKFVCVCFRGAQKKMHHQMNQSA